MAGIVKADYGQRLPGTGRYVLYPRACPCATGGARPLCAEGSEQSGWLNLCSFLYGIRILSGGMIADVRSTAEMREWLSFASAGDREYHSLCLRKESASTEAGARLRD